MAKLILDNLKEFSTYEGKALPIGEWITITQEMINDFAKATLDFQWIHVDVERRPNILRLKSQLHTALCRFP